LRGFFVSWQSGSQQVAVVFAALIGAFLTTHLSKAHMAGYGWRIPFLIGCAIIPFLFVLRGSLKETAVFMARTGHLTFAQSIESLRAHWRIVALGTMLVTMTTVSFYFITVFTPTFGTAVLHLSMLDSLVVTLCVGLSNLLWLPLGGILSDRIGRTPVLVVTTLLAVLSAYPVLAWMVAAPSFGTLLAAELWLSLLYGAYNGAMVAYLTEIVPEGVRTSGFSLAYSLATAIFGGFTPAVATYLIHATGNRAAPGLWLSSAAALGLAATLVLSRSSYGKGLVLE
jgi:MFS family permease